MINLFGEEIEAEEIVEEYKRPAAPALFDWLGSINKDKNDLRETDSELRGFDPFIINKGLMQAQNTMPFAQLMNRLPHIPKEYQYVFLKGAIPAHRGFAKWAKAAKEDRLKDVMAKTGYTKEKAMDAIRVLTDSQLDQLLEVAGGIQKNKRKKSQKKANS